jgi:peptidoglycan hydrolase-like protein with peptidoglycan-binding domain
MKLQRVIMLKMSGEDVRWMQIKLKEFGFNKERIDGYFGQNTLVSVTNFQRSVGVKPDGVVGPQTWSQLVNYSPSKEEKDIIAYNSIKDIPFNVSYMGEDGLKIYDCLLSEDEYIKQEVRKETIWLHHTAGGYRPDWTIGGWEKDFLKDKNGNPVLDSNGNPKPLKVGTSYVIGRKSSSTDDVLWDGKILRAFDDKFWAYHLGISSSKNEDLNSKSIGIEICNYGPLTLGKDSRFYNYVNKPISDSEVVELDKPFRGYKYYEKYTDAQIDSTYKLIKYLQNKWAIEIEKGIYDENWFNFDSKWFTNGGLRSHTQVRQDKFDLFPQKELIQMLNSL